MKKRDPFDFNKTSWIGRYVQAMFIFIAIVIIAVIVGGVIFAKQCSNQVGQHGLKNVIEQIWEGKGETK